MPDIASPHIFLNASWIIQGVYLLLGSMSVICWWLAFAKLIQFHRLSKIVTEDTEALREAREFQAAYLNLTPGTITHAVAQAGHDEYLDIQGLGLPPVKRTHIVLESLRHTLRDAVRLQAVASFRPLTFLGVCANAAPLMGLFGTVWGIFHSFQGFSDLNRATNLIVVGQGLGEALGTTIAGLLVAIPATLFHTYFLSRLGGLERKLSHFAQAFLKLVKTDLHREGNQEQVHSL